MYSFRNDYNTICAPKVLDAIVKFNNEQNIGYGEDYHTKNVNEILKNITKKNVDSYILAGGTMTNIVGLCQIMKMPFEAVMAVDTAHINVHETGAIESSGHKIIHLNGENGKVVPSEVKDVYHKYIDHHMVKPKVVYVSNSTEIGTIYTKEELISLRKVCDELGLYLFLDGARLGIALTAQGNDLTLADIAAYTDMFYIGGTKCGAPYGECLVIVNDNLKADMKYLIKNKLALLSKGFVGAICFEALLTNDYYLELASHANKCAEVLRNALKDYIYYDNPTNQVFIKVKKTISEALALNYSFELWEPVNETEEVIRLVTSYSTDMQMVEKFIKDFNKISE